MCGREWEVWATMPEVGMSAGADARKASTVGVGRLSRGHVEEGVGVQMVSKPEA